MPFWRSAHRTKCAFSDGTLPFWKPGQNTGMYVCMWVHAWLPSSIVLHCCLFRDSRHAYSPAITRYSVSGSVVLHGNDVVVFQLPQASLTLMWCHCIIFKCDCSGSLPRTLINPAESNLSLPQTSRAERHFFHRLLLKLQSRTLWFSVTRVSIENKLN